MRVSGTLKELLHSGYRRKMWRKAERVLAILDRFLPISSVYLYGSFTTPKARPVDIDLGVLVKTRERGNRAIWAVYVHKFSSVDLEIVPANKFGRACLEGSLWMTANKHGRQNCLFVRLK